MKYNKILFFAFVILLIGCNNSEEALKKLDFENNKAKLYQIVNNKIISSNDLEYLHYQNDELKIKYIDSSFYTFEKNNADANQIVDIMDNLNIDIIYKYDWYCEFNLNSSCHVIRYYNNGNEESISRLRKIDEWFKELDENWLLIKSECYGIE